MVSDIRDGWFDQRGTELFRDALSRKAEQLRQHLEDGRIDEDDLNQQLNTIVQKLKAIEPKLNDKLHHELGDVLQDLYVYSEMCLCYGNPERIKIVSQYI